MEFIQEVKKVAADAIKTIANETVSNEVKKRTVVAKVNSYLIQHQEIKISDNEIDNLVEEVFSDVIKQ